MSDSKEEELARPGSEYSKSGEQVERGVQETLDIKQHEEQRAMVPASESATHEATRGGNSKSAKEVKLQSQVAQASTIHNVDQQHTQSSNKLDSVEQEDSAAARLTASLTSGTRRRGKNVGPSIAKGSPRRGSNSSVGSVRSVESSTNTDEIGEDDIMDSSPSEVTTQTVMIQEVLQLGSSSPVSSSLPPGVSVQSGKRIPLARMSSQLRHQAIPLPKKLPAQGKKRQSVSIQEESVESPAVNTKTPLTSQERSSISPTRAATTIQARYRGAHTRSTIAVVPNRTTAADVTSKRPPLPTEMVPPRPQQKPPRPTRQPSTTIPASAIAKFETQIEELQSKLQLQEVRIRDEHLSHQAKLEEYQLKDIEIKKLETKIRKQDIEMNHLRNELKSEEESFEKIEQLVAEEQSKLQQKSKQLTTALEKQETLEKEVRRQRTQLYDQEKHMTRLMPTTEDVCLSARSFSENQSIQLREDTIRARDEQLEIVDAHTKKLNESIDVLESELHRVQNELMERDIELNKSKNVNKTLTERIKQLQKRIKEDTAKDAAVAAISKQNIELVQVLRGSEQEHEKVVEEKAKLVDAVASLEKKCKDLQYICAEYEANKKVDTIHAEKARVQFEQVESLLREASEKAKRELESTKNHYEHRLEELEESLNALRSTHYNTVERVQSMESDVTKARDEARRWETEAQQTGSQVKAAQAEAVASKGRVLELEKSLNREQELNSELNTKFESVSLEKDLIAKQLVEMRRVVGVGIERQHKVQDEAMELQRRVSDLKLQEEELKRRMLKEGNIQGKRRVRVELEREALQEQLAKLKQENQQLASALNKLTDDCKEKLNVATARLKLTSRELKAETDAARIRFPKLLLAVYDSLLVSLKGATHEPLNGRRIAESWGGLAWCTVRLDECRLSSHNLQELANFAMWFSPATLSEEVFKSTVALLGSRNKPRNHLVRVGLKLDLRCNGLRDAHLPPLLNCLEYVNIPLQVDLRGNHISMEGVRLIAKAIESNERSTLEIVQVYVHQNGLVEAFGSSRGTEAPGNRSTGKREMFGESSLAKSKCRKLIVVDVRENHTSTTTFLVNSKDAASPILPGLTTHKNS